MPSSLSMQRMQLTDDPDDFTWGRWYWARPGALPLPIWTAFGHPVYETDEGYERGPIGFSLAPNCYARSRVGPHKGQEFHGEPQWYQRGLPKDQRPVADVHRACGIEQWVSTAPIGPVVDTPDDMGQCVVGGGGEGSGGPMFHGGCPIYYGGCVHAEGGAEGGGPIVMGGSYGMALGGGAEGGGPIVMGGSYGMALGGGAEGGGPIAMGGYMPSPTPGGGEGGGPIVLAGGMLAPVVGGGGEGGGPIVLAGVGGLDVGGGGEGGGGLTMTGGYSLEVIGGAEGGGPVEMEGEGDDVPIGMMMPYAGDEPPPGWLECDGTYYEQSAYPALYAVIGDTWNGARGYEGVPPGHFRVPNLHGCVVGGAGDSFPAGGGAGATTEKTIADFEGTEEVQLTEAEMPAHAHAIGLQNFDSTDSEVIPNNRVVPIGEAGATQTTEVRGESAPHSNTQPTCWVLWCIKAE